jgi:hypothetical protein
VGAAATAHQPTAQRAAQCHDALGHALRCSSGSYSIEAVYFNAKRYRSTADCLTAAHAAALPLELCR